MWFFKFYTRSLLEMHSLCSLRGVQVQRKHGHSLLKILFGRNPQKIKLPVRQPLLTKQHVRIVYQDIAHIYLNLWPSASHWSNKTSLHTLKKAMNEWCAEIKWINYIYYNQQRLANYSRDAFKALGEQLHATSQNNWICCQQEKEGGCMLYDHSCCSFIPNNTSLDHSITKVHKNYNVCPIRWETFLVLTLG